ncbi:protein-L-isoaspartate(D-aspartate) O-methyltransferase [Anaerobaca lacustris]|uniref:Protein-L-isoaspartate O-methyltransferase n=1 Tax=Anaerobaca lacustris TaxID=3044600 RepID=A0AAW6U801_9BACT|nr:protein-L-isoaspartate(D-aspartate) O-methyltransferase [Sedimentisphaerales bacterium M17dextr]
MDRRKMGPREHLGLLFVLVLLLSLWFVRHTSREPAFLAVTENPNAQEQERASEPNEVESTRPDHSHPAFAERVVERQRMVDSQIRSRDVKDPNTLKAMQAVPRHAFVPARYQPSVYEDHPLPIEEGQTISQPYIVAFMTEVLKLDPNSIVLEIGTGSGYQAAVCAEIARRVYTIEIVEPLAVTAAKRLKELGYSNVFVKAGDGYYGWPEKGPFDAIIGTAAADRIPPPLIEQLKPGGRMILPVRGETGFQYLILITKDAEGRLDRLNVMPVRFVPMTGEVQKRD